MRRILSFWCGVKNSQYQTSNTFFTKLVCGFFCLFLVILFPPFLLAEDAALDVDGSGVVNATDGVLILRRLNGGSTIDTGVVLPAGKSNADVLGTIDQRGMALDVDGSGVVNATDGVLILRRLNGGSTIDTGVVLPAGKSNSDVVAAIDALRGFLQEISVQDYYPLLPGTVWSYQEAGEKQPTITVAQSTEKVLGKETRLVLYAGGTLPDRQENYSNSTDGLLFHRLFYVNSRGEGNTVLFETPLVMARAVTAVGSILSTKGKASVKRVYPDDNENWIETEADFQATSEIVGFETVTVPAGTYTALQIRRSLSLKALDQSISTTSTFWFAKTIGIVKEVSSISGTEVSTELIKVEP